MNDYNTDNNGVLDVLLRSFNIYFIGTWKKAFDFQGRASRKQLWLFRLWDLTVFIFLFLLDSFLGFTKTQGDHIYGFMSSIYGLFDIIPSISLLIRRFHDIGVSGMRFFIVSLFAFGSAVLSASLKSNFFLFISSIGGLLFFYYLIKALFKKGEPYSNNYGLPPEY